MLFLSVNSLKSTQHLSYKDYAIELRLDLFPNINLEAIHNFLKNSASPVMLTVRKKSQGGNFQGEELEREELIQQLLELKPPFFDLEYDMNPPFLHEMIHKFPKTRFILSYHNFQALPKNLEEIYCFLQRHPAFGYKMAVITHSTNDALTMLKFAKNHLNLSVICMGKEGVFARILGSVFGNLNYASIDSNEQTGPNQLSVTELVDIYRYPSLNKDTSIYGLIGDPVDNSLGHIYHNAVFQEQQINAVYVKMRVRPEELAEFIPLAKGIGIQGLSVTSPLKEKILPFLDEIAPEAQQIGAVNTLLFTNGRIVGTNTDGLGALDAIEKRTPVHGKKMVLIGAGGAARSIAFEAKRRGGDVLVLNRTVSRAKGLGVSLGCTSGGLSEIPKNYDILIQCTKDPNPIPREAIQPNSLVMDIVYSSNKTPFLNEARLKNCQIVDGKEMFLNQARRQTAFWFPPKKILIPPLTEFHFGRNLLETIPILTRSEKKRTVLIADGAIKDLYAVNLAKKTDAALLTIPSGEKGKTLETATFLMDQLFQMGCDRNTLLIALGGGMTTDLVGFIASIYMRGIPVILIPTTLVGIVDASIGGKTAINAPYGKNLIGTIYPPKAVFADLTLLDTLPKKEWFNGLAEILKMGLVYDPTLLEMSQKNIEDPELIFRAIQGKAAIVTQDLKELGLRHILNFGHTIGHALETVSEYEISHGEAVALGCLAEAHLSMHLGYLEKKDFEQIEAIYLSFPLSFPKKYERAKFLSVMNHDKKKRLGTVRFVLIEAIGRAIPFEGTYCRFVTDSELEPTLAWIENWKSPR